MKGERRRRVAVAGGGTGGHVIEGLAIMLAYRDACDADVYFIGCEGGYEKKLIPGHGFTLELIPGAPYARQRLWGKAWSMIALFRGVMSARRLLKSRRTELVIGVGGYASLGAVLAARTLGIGAVIHEANVVAGLANRVLGHFVHRVFVGWDQARHSFRRVAIAVIGNPVLPEIAAVRQAVEAGWQKGPVRILVTGGSVGSPFLNEHAPNLLSAVRRLGVEIAVRHQTGEGNVEPVQRAYEREGIDARVEPFIDDMAAAYSETHFVITAAGAVTLAELSVLGLPSLLVPIQAAANEHQIANAKTFIEAAGGAWIAEAEWRTDSLAPRLAALLSDRATWGAQTQRLRQMARPNAAGDLVRECEALLARR